MSRYLLHRVSLWIPQELRHKLSPVQALGVLVGLAVLSASMPKPENALHYLELIILILTFFHKLSN